MSLNSLSKKCRACLTTNFKHLLNWHEIVDYLEENISYADCFQECTRLEASDDLPQMLCWECAVQLKLAYIFIKKCKESDLALRLKHEDVELVDLTEGEFDWLDREQDEPAVVPCESAKDSKEQSSSLKANSDNDNEDGQSSNGNSELTPFSAQRSFFGSLAEETETSSPYRDEQLLQGRSLWQAYQNSAASIYINLDDAKELKRLLESTNKIVFQTFKAQNQLTNNERVKISKTIIQHLLVNPQRRLTTDELQIISETISRVFVGELPTTFYLKSSKGRHASGKLHDAYNNYRSRLAASGLIVRRRKVPVLKQPDTEEGNSRDQALDENLLQELSSDLSVDIAMEPWKQTFRHRQQLLKEQISVTEYLRKFPALEQPEGYKLCLVDIELGFKNKLAFPANNRLVSNILSHTKSRSEPVLKIMELIRIEPKEFNKPVLAFMLIPYLLAPPNKRTSQGIFKLTKLECANTFICHFENADLAESAIHNFRKIAANDEKELQPLIVLIGSPVKLAWVVFADVKYEFPNIREAVAVAIAVYLSLHLKYPTWSEQAWFFLQKYIFNLSTRYDDRLENKVKTLANDLKIIEK